MVDVKWCVVTRVCRWCYHQVAWSTAVGSRAGRSTSWKMTSVPLLYCSSSFPIKVLYWLIVVRCVNESQLVFCCLVKSKFMLCDLTSDYNTLWFVSKQSAALVNFNLIVLVINRLIVLCVKAKYRSQVEGLRWNNLVLWLVRNVVEARVASVINVKIWLLHQRETVSDLLGVND